MNAWWIIALGIIALGIISGIIVELYSRSMGFRECTECAFGACVVEAIVYGFYKLIPWVIGWDTSILTKVSFILIPTTLVLGIVFGIVGFAIDDAERKIASRIFFTLMVLSLASFVASIFICPVAAWISSTAWRIAIWSPLGLVLVFCVSGLLWAIWTDDGKAPEVLGHGGYAYSFGPHSELIQYYYSRREYRRAQKEPKVELLEFGGGDY